MMATAYSGSSAKLLEDDKYHFVLRHLIASAGTVLCCAEHDHYIR